MRLSSREKQTLYSSLAQLVRSGVPFPRALDKLAATSRGPVRRLVNLARARLADGKTVGEAFGSLAGVTPLEASVIAAVEKSGQLDRGLSELASYFRALHEARATVIRRCAYPVFLLHLGILVINLPTLVLQSPEQFVQQTLTFFLLVYAAVGVIGIVAPALRDSGARSAATDRLLRSIPLVGKIRRAFALSRFCTVYGLQLDAGVNIMDSLMMAGRASRSGLVRSAVASAIPEVRSGAQVGPLLAASGAFPDDFVQTLIVGEETGGLDEELRRMAEDLRNEALGRLETLGDVLPKLIYAAIVVYLGWRALKLIQTGIVAPYQKILDGM